MNPGNYITAKLNSVEHFIEHAPGYMFPIKVLGWLLLFLALMVTNVMALIKWPFSAISSRLVKKEGGPGIPIEVTSDDELQTILAEHGTVMVDFWAQWCGPCLLMNKAVHSLAEDYADDVVVVKVDVSLSAKLSKHYAVKGLPTVILFKDGSETVRKSGSLTRQQLAELVQ